jgi:uncharacterized protein involved in response to NO
MPLQGAPLAALVGLWLAGRAAVLAVDEIGLDVAAVVDVAFLVALWAVIAREIAAGRNWRNAPVLAAVAAFAVAHVLFWLGVSGQVPVGLGERLAIGVLTLLIGLIGGRIVPSFTRNWLKKQGATRFPVAAGAPDRGLLILTAGALGLWVALPQHPVTAGLCAAAALGHLWRLSRWRGLATVREPLLLVLHLGYLWVPVGLALIALVPVLPAVTGDLALHALTAGGVGTMTLAVMTRASRGHTGRPLSADMATTLVFVAVIASAVLRLLAPLPPVPYFLALKLSAGLWVAAFALFCLAYAPILARPRRG